MSQRSARIMLVDDHDLFRSGLRMIVESLPPANNAVYEASSGEECISLIRDKKIDIIFMDYSLPGMDGLSASMRLLQIYEDLKIIILTGVRERPVSTLILHAGISGYMTKASATDEVGQAIKCVMDGGIYLSREIVVQMSLDSLKRNSLKPCDRKQALDNLSRRELQVALLLMEGHKSGEVGDMLSLSPKSVSTYKRRAFEKLKVESLVELVEVGRDSGFVGNYEQRS